MKLQYKLGIFALGLVAFTSCEKNDPFADHLIIGQPVPTCYWEVGSTVCKAGESFSFKGQYYTEKGHTPSHSEVWYNVTLTDEASATAKLAGTGFTYTKQFSISEEEVRMNQSIYKFDHSLAVWDGYEFVLTATVPVSESLVPINWNTPKEWEKTEKNKFATYFPEGFAEEFENAVDSLIVTDNYYNSLRYLYANYAFTNERFAEINAQFGTEFPTDIKYSETDKQASVTDKMNRWFDGSNPYNPNPGSTDPVPPADTVAYYYPTLNGETVVYNRITKEEAVKDDFGTYRYAADKSIIVYPIYASAPWVFSRYDDDKGAVVSTVIPEYIEAFKALVEPITFQEWIKGDDGYAISFKRKFVLDANYRVFDTDGNEGVAHTSYQIEIN